MSFTAHQTLLRRMSEIFYYKGFVLCIHSSPDVYQDFPFPKFKITLGSALRWQQKYINKVQKYKILSKKKALVELVPALRLWWGSSCHL